VQSCDGMFWHGVKCVCVYVCMCVCIWVNNIIGGIGVLKLCVCIYVCKCEYAWYVGHFAAVQSCNGIFWHEVICVCMYV
jgi:hypothetical protein